MTMHQSAIDRMKREGMVNLAAETVRHAIDDRTSELADTRADIALHGARDGDEAYVGRLERELTELRARLAQLEAS